MKTTTDTSKKLRSTLLAAAVAMACGSALAQQNPINDTDTTANDSQTTQYPSDQPSLPTDPVPTEQQPNDPMNPNDPATDPLNPGDPLNQNMEQPAPPDRTMQSDPRPDSELSQYETRENRADDPVSDEPAPEQAATDKQDWSGQAGDNALAEELGNEADLGEFVAALEAAGLTKALSSGTEYTVFAPTDDAFAKFKEDKGEDWSAEQNVEELREVLRSHVVSGKLERSQLAELDSAQVLTGSVVEVSTDGDEIKIGDAKVEGDAITTASNLTIYKIDGVLDPSAMSEGSTEQGAMNQPAPASGSAADVESQRGTPSQYGTESQYDTTSESATQGTAAAGTSEYDSEPGEESEFGAESQSTFEGTESTDSTAAGTLESEESDTSQPYEDTQQYDSEYEDELTDEEEAEE